MSRETANVFYGLLAVISLDKLAELAAKFVPTLQALCLFGQALVALVTFIYVILKIRQTAIAILKLNRRRK